MNIITKIVKYYTVLKPYKRIVLFSHMRANTSVFGHILGSNPEIEGYYELHIGYYSWKSLIRQKLLYFADHQAKKTGRYLFDKILHNEHDDDLNPELFKNDNDKIIIMIREPSATIASIIKLYQRLDPEHEFATLAGAAKYYNERLIALQKLAEKFANQFYFLNADDLTQSPDETLSKLSHWLNLKAPLTKEYNLFVKTGERGAGDSSENMKKGVLQSKTITPQSSLDSNENLYQEYMSALNFICNFAANRK